MKPWFVKEADIIKFPEPEKKVIELPNVQNYPDFLTGVKDLYNRKDKGEISQDSHDRLYQDLIHRFMKKESFETPWYLREVKQEPLPNKSKRGEVNEHFLGTAITAKFLAGEKNITGTAFKNVRSRIKLTDEEAVEFTGPAKDKIISRNVYKSDATKQDFFDDTTMSIMESEIKGDIAFANSDTYTTKISKFFAENGKPDVVRVSAVGGEDEKGSKVDIDVDYIQPDGSVRRLRPISLKTASGQMGQGSPKTVQGLQTFFKPLGVEIGDIENYGDDIEGNVMNAFKSVNNQLQQILQGDKDKSEQVFLGRVINFLDFHITKNDPKVVLVNIEKGNFSVLKIKNIMKNVANINLNSRMRIGKSGDGRPLPEIKIFDQVSGKELFLMRLKISGGKEKTTQPGKFNPIRYTLLVDVKPLFKSLAQS